MSLQVVSVHSMIETTVATSYALGKVDDDVSETTLIIRLEICCKNTVAALRRHAGLRAVQQVLELGDVCGIEQQVRWNGRPAEHKTTPVREKLCLDPPLEEVIDIFKRLDYRNCIEHLMGNHDLTPPEDKHTMVVFRIVKIKLNLLQV
jgi:hypothetical protein